MTRALGIANVLTLALVACGGTASSATAPTSMVSPASSTLTVSGCVIPEGAASCTGSITWAIANARAPRVTVGGVTVSTEAMGTASPSIGASTQTVSIFDGTALLGEKSISGTCASASAWNGARCLAYAERLTERAPTPFVENGRPVTLEVVLFRPLVAGSFPTVLFHHGSTGDGTDPLLFTQTYTSEAVARFFTERGFLVVFAQRRGRGASDGIYDEGFTPNRSGYSCVQALTLAGFEHAMADVDAIVTWVSQRSDVDPKRLISAGISRGGVLALTHAAERPGVFLAGINFVGGWLGEGCSDGPAVNRLLFQRAGRFPASTVWLYGENDTFYSMPHSRGNFSTFTSAGGQGTFHAYTRAAGLNGHFVINDPKLWGTDLATFVDSLPR